MADLQTLNPFSTKPKEQKYSSQNQIGGPMGFLNEAVEIGGEFLRSPQQIASEGGSFIKEGLGSLVGLIKEDMVGIERKGFSSGSIEDFRTPHNSDLEAVKRSELLEQRMRFNNSVLEMKRNADAIEERQFVETQARFEMAGMSDPEFAEAAGYDNKSFIGKIGNALRTLANAVIALFRKNNAENENKKENTFYNVMNGKLSALDRFTQARFASEQAGGQHVMSAVG